MDKSKKTDKPQSKKLCKFCFQRGDDCDGQNEDFFHFDEGVQAPNTRACQQMIDLRSLQIKRNYGEEVVVNTNKNPKLRQATSDELAKCKFFIPCTHCIACSGCIQLGYTIRQIKKEDGSFEFMGIQHFSKDVEMPTRDQIQKQVDFLETRDSRRAGDEYREQRAEASEKTAEQERIVHPPAQRKTWAKFYDGVKNSLNEEEAESIAELHKKIDAVFL